MLQTYMFHFANIANVTTTVSTAIYYDY